MNEQVERNAYDHQQNEDRVWEMICSTPIQGYGLIQDNAANRGIVLGWVQDYQGEVFSLTWLKKVLQEQPSLGDQIAWQVSPEWQKVIDSRKLEQDRESFEQIRREHLLADNKANFALWRSTHSVDGMVRASAEEFEAYHQEAVEQHNEALQKMDPTTLRAQVRYEAEQARATNAQAEADSQLQDRVQRDSHLNFPVLPTEFQGQPLNATFIKKAPPETIRFLRKKYGPAQLDQRLRNTQ